MTSEPKNLEKEVAEEILAQHLLNFYKKYTKTLKIINLTFTDILAIVFLCTLIGALVPTATGVILGVGIGVLSALFYGGYFSGLLFGSLTSIGIIFNTQEEQKRKPMRERLLKIAPDENEAPQKMRELAKFLIDEQLINENKNLKEINLYKVASHAIAGLKIENDETDIPQAMLTGVAQKIPLVSLSPWFWIKCAFMKLKQAFQFNQYYDQNTSKNFDSDAVLYSQPLGDLEIKEVKQKEEPDNKHTSSFTRIPLVGNNRSRMFSSNADELILEEYRTPTINSKSNTH